MGIPLIDGRMDDVMGQVQVVILPYVYTVALHLVTSKVLSERLKRDGLPSTFDQPKMPAIITTTSIIAGLIVRKFIKVVHDIESFRREDKWNEKIGESLTGKRLFINLNILNL